MLPYSGDHQRSPPPPPPPRAVFSSSLSPSAAPFPAADPVGPGPGPVRDLPTAPSVYAAGGDWGAVSWMEPPASYMAPAATPPGYKGESTPYGIYSRNHFSNLLGLHSLRSESSNSVNDKQTGNCQESSEALTKDFGPSAFHQQQSAFVSKLLDNSGAEDTGPYPPRQDLNQYPFGSTYDKYITQLSSCSTDTQPHILSTRYVNSSEMANTTVPLMNDTIGESSFSFSSYMNPCRINLDYFDCVWNEQKGLGYQTTDKQHGKWSNPDDKATVGNYSLNSPGENHLNPEHLGNGRPMQGSSEMKHDLGSFSSKVSSSESGFVQPRECSSEFPEVNNTSVDSPCWKGTPASYQSSFGIMENNGAPPVVIGTVGYINPHQNQKLPELSSEYPWRFCEHHEASGSENDPFKAFKLPERCKISKDHKEVPPNDFRVLNDMTTHASYLPDKQHSTTHKCYDSEDSKNVIASSQQESSCPASKPKLLGEHGGSLTASINELMSKDVEKEESTHKRGEDPSQCYPGVEGNMLNVSSESSSSTRAIFLKLMHNLSVALLSTCKGGSSLQEGEEELLQSVIQNLTAASSKRSKVEQKIDDRLSNSSQMKLKNINCARNDFWRSMHGDSAQENADSELKATVSQVLTNHLEDKMLDNTEVSQVSIYRNLWIEAEASACKLKYELQHARLKLETAKGLNNTVKAPDSLEGSKGSISYMSSSKPQDHGKETITCTAAFQGQGGDTKQSPVVNRNIFNGVDADVFARFKVLQSRTDNVNSFSEIDCGEPQEASKRPYAVEDDVMVRLKVLKSRPDNITSLIQESNKHQLDASANSADNVDDAVMGRLRILESHPNSAVLLGQESSKQPLDTRTNREDGNGIDDAVMARLRILKSRPDNETSVGDANKEQQGTFSDQSNGDDLGVVCNGAISNTLSEKCSNFMHSDDLADRLGGKDSVGGLETFGDGGNCAREKNEIGGSADIATPMRCKGRSDEVSIQSAVHGDKLGENHVWLQTAGDSHVCTEGSQEAHIISSPVDQYGGSPTEWEHVLKENFFHPGK
ncbi:hypothetical protein BDA96_01G336500 [Sorghum bicolor]|uniref:Uncharacterized protein n=3 Tax=Sorghum bicolor TaxID=4558 RepID=A0A921S1M9_SORBI|nr:uncharacterized protein LOC8058812 isoform X2 [Sorghum bicolor]KAG0550418.1 hypothetical protein BDA96_01G336500 [Sorghum bicolor]OQU92229.1 hypothetical protein SORBI_3001G313700 [Sorghum bicolor]|eukprot:XP_021307381.1 uncharacterized protein LOC8058812 isoform X2 [Sorghum bicolor]